MILTDANSVPLTQGSVEIDHNGQALAVLNVGTNGQLTVPNLAAGNYTLDMSAVGFAPTTQAVTFDRRCDDNGFAGLDPAGIVSGVVQNGSGSPIAGISVGIEETDSLGNDISQQTNTATDGTYSFPDLPYGTYALTVGNDMGILRQDGTLSLANPQAMVDFTVAGEQPSRNGRRSGRQYSRIRCDRSAGAKRRRARHRDHG